FRLGGVRPRRRRPSDSVGASRLALAAFALRPPRRPDRSDHAVGIGAPSSPTPVGSFAVAEKLTGPFGPALGPRILVLTARQPRLPPGWNTSVTYYIAIHSGSGRGSAVSAGCLHATEADVRYLMRTVPLGAAVQILR